MQLRVKVAGLETLWWCKLFLIASPTLHILLFLNRSDYRICHIYHRRRFWSSKWHVGLTVGCLCYVTLGDQNFVTLGGQNLHAGLTLGWLCHLGWSKFWSPKPPYGKCDMQSWTTKTSSYVTLGDQNLQNNLRCKISYNFFYHNEYAVES